MSNDHEYVSTKLYIRGEHLDGKEITLLLATRPDEVLEPGQTIFSKNAEQPRYVVRKGHWRLDFPKSQRHSWDVENQLQFWGEFLSSREVAVHTLHTLGYSITVDCYISEGPVLYFGLPFALLDTFARLKISLTFGIYDWTDQKLKKE